MPSTLALIYKGFKNRKCVSNNFVNSDGSKQQVKSFEWNHVERRVG